MLPSVLSLLGLSFRLYRQHAGLLAGYAAWLLLPFAFFVLTPLLPNETAQNLVTIGVSVIQTLLALWLVVLFVLLANVLIDGKPFDLGEIQAKVWPLVPPLVFVSVLELLITLGGLLLFIIPGILFVIWFSFAEFSVLLEGKRGFAALAASRSLFHGRFWSVLYRLAGGPVLLFALYSVIVLGLYLLLSLATGVAPEALLASSQPPLWAELLATAVEVFLLPWLVLYVTLLYKALKRPL